MIDNQTKKFIYEHCLFELKDDPQIVRRVKDITLLGIAICRLRESGFTKVCTRCGGTGNHSFMPGVGTYCFKCMGAKCTFPKATDKWKQSVVSFDWRGKYGKNKSTTTA